MLSAHLMLHTQTILYNPSSVSTADRFVRSTAKILSIHWATNAVLRKSCYRWTLFRKCQYYMSEALYITNKYQAKRTKIQTLLRNGICFVKDFQMFLRNVPTAPLIRAHSSSHLGYSCEPFQRSQSSVVIMMAQNFLFFNTTKVGSFFCAFFTMLFWIIFCSKYSEQQFLWSV